MIRRVLLLTPIITGFLAPFAFAQNYPFTKIADTSTPVPGTGGTYTSFGLPTASREYGDGDGASFFFSAQSSNGNSGVYLSMVENLFPITSLSRIADTTMTALTGSTFASFSDTTSGFGAMGFIAEDSNKIQGIYEADVPTNYGTIHLVAQPSDSPSSGTTFGAFEGLSVMGGGNTASYEGETRGEIVSSTGVYDFDLDTYSPTPSVTFQSVAAVNTTPSGASGPFTQFGPPSYKAPRGMGNIQGFKTDVSAFRATAGGVEGIYYNYQIGASVDPHAPNLQLLVSTAAPSIQNFTSFGDPVASSAEIAFTAHYTTASRDQQGIFSYGEYLYSNDPINPPPALVQLFATGQTAPNTSGAHFASFGTIALDFFGGGLFLATLDNGIEGLFSFQDQNYELGLGPITVSDVLNTGQTIDGKIVSDIEISTEAIADVDAVCKLDFTDGSSGIYHFNINPVPEPACLCFCGLPFLLLTRRRS